VANGAFFLSAARRSGVESAEAEVVHDAVAASGVQVRRFGRAAGPLGRVGSPAQEDACRVLGRYPTCNGDAHAKNFSVRRLPDGEWRVTPAYDLPSSHPYGDTTMALSVNGRSRQDIGKADFLALGEPLGLGARAVAPALDEHRERVDLWLPGLDTLPFDGRRTQRLRRRTSARSPVPSCSGRWPGSPRRGGRPGGDRKDVGGMGG
jgi:serine/threonine-protein kinase HipA